MADTGFVIAGTGTSVDTGSLAAWSNPGNITADDGSNASSAGTFVQATSDDLKASNFGFSIPTGATIDGIEVRAQLAESGGNAAYSYVNVGKDDATLATSKSPGSALTTTLTDYDAGGAADLWSLSWTPAEINSSDFQVRIRLLQNATVTGLCDAIWAKIYYTEAAADGNVASMLIGL